MEQLGQAIRTNSGEAERSLSQLAASTVEAIRATRARDRTHHYRRIGDPRPARSSTTWPEVERLLTQTSASVSSTMRQDSEDVERALSTVSSRVSSVLKQDSGSVEQALNALALSVSAGLKQNADEAERTLLGASTRITGTLKQEAEESERTLLSASTRVSSCSSRIRPTPNERCSLRRRTSRPRCASIPKSCSARSERCRPRSARA
jgi:hypothetical protein